MKCSALPGWPAGGEKKKTLVQRGVYRCLRSISGGRLWSMDGCRSAKLLAMNLLNPLVANRLYYSTVEGWFHWVEKPMRHGEQCLLHPIFKNSFLVIQKILLYEVLMLYIIIFLYWFYFLYFFSFEFSFFSLFLPLFFFFIFSHNQIST